MADAATVTISATLLPDEIAKAFSGSMTVTPADSSEKWYYKLTSCTATSTDLIAGAFLDYTPVDDDTSPTAIAPASDLVKFLYVENVDSDDGVYIRFDAGTAAHSTAENLFIGPGQAWFGQLPFTLVGSIHAISADIAGTGGAPVNLIVAAIIKDV